MADQHNRREFLRQIAGLGAAATLGVGLGNCGSDARKTDRARGWVRIRLAWPGRFIPPEAQSVRIEVTDRLGTTQSRVFRRAAGPTEATFAVLVGPATVAARAYATEEATGPALAQAQAQVSVVEGRTIAVPLILAPTERPHLPNILLILVDDLGYADLGVQGCQDISTPHLDSLAWNGVRFTNGYVSCPVCSPTRAGLLTGRYQQRFGHELNPPNPPGPQFGLPLTEVTLAERLSALGYTTGVIGKWHLGSQPEFRPPNRGFDEFFGFLGGQHPYLPSSQAKLLRGTEWVQEPEYLTDAFTREAVAFIERHRQEPFFLYLSFNAVHLPLEATEKYLDRFSSIADENRRTFAAMLSALDDGVGQVLAKLRETGLEEETLIGFLSDNGGYAGNTSRNDPLRGHKDQVFEGGIRVPFLVQWTGHLPAGQVYEHPVISLDLAATALAAAGGPLPEELQLDGVNLLPYLTGANSAPPHDRLYWRYGTQQALRAGDWKMVKWGDNPPQLYNLAEDIGESHNLAAGQPDKLQELQADYEAWNAQLIDPLW